MIDLDKAEALLRAEGCALSRGRNWVLASAPGVEPVMVRCECTSILPPEAVLPEDAEALAAALLRAAALCRRIERECQR